MKSENEEQRVLPPTQAGATILQVVRTLRDEAIGRTAVNVAYSLPGARMAERYEIPR